MILLKNVPTRVALVLALLGVTSSAGCEREARPGAGCKPAAAVASAAAPDATVEGEQPGRREAGNGSGAEHESERKSESERASGGLVPATAAELLAAIKTSGKRGTLVNAWASWCGPCRREVPMLQALAANLKPQGVEIVLVSVDEPKDEAKAQSFLKDNGITLKSYLVEGSVADFKAAINPNWPGMLPASFLFDRTATLVHFWGGEAFENEIVPVVEAFVAGRAIDAETRYGLAPGKVE